jgi:hypothetical protein
MMMFTEFEIPIDQERGHAVTFRSMSELRICLLLKYDVNTFLAAAVVEHPCPINEKSIRKTGKDKIIFIENQR